MPESVRKSHVRFERENNAPAGPVENATAHAKTRTTPVRTAVARLESTLVTPILARMAVSPANSAERSDHVSQFMRLFVARLDDGAMQSVRRGAGVPARRTG